MMERWKEYKIGDFAKVTSSKRIYLKYYVPNGIPFYRSREVIEKYNGEEITNTLFISENRYNEIKLKFGVPKKRDILITSVGTIGIPYLVKDDYKFYFKDGNLTWIKDINENAFPEYIYYWVISPLGKGTLYNYLIGSSQKALTIESLKQIKINLPPLPTQRKIANILSAYDDLIENNIKRIKLLEEMAQKTYEEWFVRFKFPGYETAVFDEETGLPEGWEKVKLTDYIDLIRGVEPGSSNYENTKTDSNIPFIRVGDLNKRESNIYIPTKLSKNKYIENSDIVLSLDGSPGIVKYGLHGCYSTGIRKAISKKNSISNIFIYNLLNFRSIQGLIEAYSTGATILHAGSSVKKMMFVFPTDDVLNRYNYMADKNFKIILNLQIQNQHLKEARDILLPRLMTGMVDVDKIKIEL